MPAADPTRTSGRPADGDRRRRGQASAGATVLRTFVELAGGAGRADRGGPDRSSLGPEVVEVYDALFRRLGAADGRRGRAREPARRPRTPSSSALLDDVTGIFMTGGNQLKLSAVVTGTAFGEAIRAAHAPRRVGRRHSAGRQHPVLAHGRLRHRGLDAEAADDPARRRARPAAAACVIDQHFGQRNRYGRLLMLVAQSPGLLGIGVDEDTAAVITRRTAPDPRGGRPRRGHGLRRPQRRLQRPRGHGVPRRCWPPACVLHVLPAGRVFDLTARRARPHGPPVAEPAEAEELAAVAGQDLSGWLGTSPRRRYPRACCADAAAAPHHEGDPMTE